ncbi:MAG: hypothetical protein E7253_02775 [Lachnospiraceae bacterium]|nr:hypothetical protein [Lachnospiraceae bacterium]
MLSIQIQDVKEFMNQLLRSDLFHPFYLWEASIKTSVSYHIDGRLNQDFYNTEELETLPQTDYIPWAQIKPQIFSMIKGSKTPLSMKIILMLSNANTNQILTKYNLPLSAENINGLFLNIHYDGTNLSCTTGVSYRTFTLDKRLEAAFEENILNWLRQLNIAFLVH